MMKEFILISYKLNIMLSQEEKFKIIDELAQLGKKMNAQNNRSTQFPLFEVRDKEHRPVCY